MTTSLSFPVHALLLLGPTGVGKSPLGDLLAARGFLGKHCYHLDFGAELRRIHQTTRSTSPYSRVELDFIQGVLERGLLLEDKHFALARKIISHFLERNSFHEEDILVLNGIPRHTGQARDIATLASISALIVLDSSPESIYRRLRENVGGDRTERNDDGKELVAEKLKTFQERTAPLIHQYKKTGTTVYHIPVTHISTNQETYDLLASLAAANPPVALIAEPPQR